MVKQEKKDTMGSYDYVTNRLKESAAKKAAAEKQKKPGK